MGKLIGIFGGSFDPIHIGHLNLAAEMMEAHYLHEVWFCPAAQNPLKHNVTAGAEQRLEMLRLAIEGQPRFRILETEIKKEGPSYTIDTLEALSLEQEGSAEPNTFALILGYDAAKGFHLWHRPDEIITYAFPLVGRRINEVEEGPEGEFEGSPEVIEALKKGLTPTRIMEISSIEVRYRLRKGKYCGHLVPGKVLDYISKHHLYLPPSPEARFL
jgi:nicotinate-nucleotide adenylyltransferase